MAELAEMVPEPEGSQLPLGKEEVASRPNWKGTWVKSLAQNKAAGSRAWFVEKLGRSFWASRVSLAGTPP